MNSEKVKEIKKVLECCANWNGQTSCNDCPIGSGKCFEDGNLMPRLALTLINELEKELKQGGSYAKGYADGIKNTYEVAVPDKLKQFAERLKEKTAYSFIFGKKFIVENDIDETLKEFINNKGER